MKNIFEKIKLNKCPVCKSDDIKFFIKKYDDRYGYDDIFDIYFCLNCECSFIENPIKEEYLGKLYSKYYSSNNYSNNENNKITLISRIIKILNLKKILDFLTGNLSLGYFINKKGKILDYGCGNDLNAIISKTLKQNWIGMDVNYELIEKLEKKGYRCYCGTLNNISNIVEKFDYILMSQVIEHTYDPILILQNAKKLLNKGGKIIISTPNLASRYNNKKNWINWHVPYHTILFRKTTFDYISNKLNLKIDSYKVITPVNWYLTQKNIKKIEQGEVNNSFKQSISITNIFLFSIYLRIKETFKKSDGDCIYIELTK